MTYFLRKAVICAALAVTSHPALSAGVQFNDASKTASFDCHRMIVPEKSYLTVDVTHDEKRAMYIYQYTLRTSDPKSPGVHGVLFQDLADNKSTSTFKGARPCMTGPGRAVCSGGTTNMENGVAGPITLESAAAPGVVRYSLTGEVRSGLTDADFSALTARFDGDREEMIGTVEDAMSEACSYDRAKNVFERGMTGTIMGPSEVAFIEASISAPSAKSTKRSVELKSSAASTARVENLRPESIVVTDSRLLPVQTGVASVDRSEANAQAVRFDLMQKMGACNVRGVLIRGTLLDGTPVAGGVEVEPSACPFQVDRVTLQLPTS